MIIELILTAVNSVNEGGNRCRLQLLLFALPEKTVEDLPAKDADAMESLVEKHTVLESVRQENQREGPCVPVKETASNRCSVNQVLRQKHKLTAQV